MRIAKEFRWEMGHRLPFHDGKCKNLHGHSYKMMIELTGENDNSGMVLDYYVLKKIIQPLIEKLDHTFMVKKDDKKLIELLTQMESKYVKVDFDTTAENLVTYFLNEIKEAGLPDNIHKIKVRIFETESTYAEDEISLV